MLESMSKDEHMNAEAESRMTRVIHAYPRPLFSDKYQSSSLITSSPVRLVLPG